jgi:hypothetical protein
MEEIWKDIPGFEGYQASNLGRIKSTRRSKETILKPWLRGAPNRPDNRYKAVSLMHKNKRSTHYVHKLVIETFIGKTNDTFVCDHIDRNKFNNNLSNLRWVSASDNSLNRDYNGNLKKGVRVSEYNYVLKNGTVKKYDRYESRITINKKCVYIGSYKTIDEAHEAYKQAYLNHYGYEWMG